MSDPGEKRFDVYQHDGKQAWLANVLARIANMPITRLEEASVELAVTQSCVKCGKAA